MTVLETISRSSGIVERWVSRPTLAFTWLALLLLIILTVVQVVGRQFYRANWVGLYDHHQDTFLFLMGALPERALADWFGLRRRGNPACSMGRRQVH
jgi:hypothetical protein